MSQSYIGKDLRERVANQALHRCGYCLTCEVIVGTPMEIEHLIPESLGGFSARNRKRIAYCSGNASSRTSSTSRPPKRWTCCGSTEKVTIAWSPFAPTIK